MRNNIFVHEFESQFDCPPLTVDSLREVERDLGVRLPSSLIELLRLRNGGLLLAELPLQEGEVRQAYGANRVSIIGVMGVCASNGIGKQQNDFLRKNWDYPENTVVFSHAAHAGFALDYRRGSEPSVIFVYAEMYPVVLVAEVAPSFEAFLDSLEQREWDT
jgi:hypothetical protein